MTISKPQSDSVYSGQMPEIMSPWRKDFPILLQEKAPAFLDTGASAQKPRAVIDAMTAVMEGHYANIHRGLYKFSQETTSAFEAVRGKVQKFLNAANENEIIFTRNTTDAVNLVAQSWGRANLNKGDNIILTEMEHHANIVPWQLLQDAIGFEIRVIPVIPETGVLDLSVLDTLVDANTKFLGIVHVSNALGTINPVKDIIQTVKAINPQIITLVDGSQSAVHGSVDVQDLGCDFFTVTAHKLYGPTGIGALYGRLDLLNSMPPYQGGGDMIEEVSFSGTTYKDAPARFEAGTPPIIEVIGFGAALDYMDAIGMDKIAAHEHSLLSYTMDKLRQMEGITLYADTNDKAPIISFNIDGAHHSDVGMILDQCGVAVRTGHHCTMPLMAALGVDGTVRASFGLYNDITDCDRLIAAVKKAKKMLTGQ